jgi:hypothetical protein
MTKQFYDKVVSDLEAIKERTVSSEPITQKQLNEFRKESIEMLEIVNGTKEYKPAKPEVKMTTQKGFKTTKYELKLSAILNRG